ncbi:Peroxisomal membrane protein PEX14 [Geodia barretti]|uniref:Peroxisomal membrane protein PEX14 n=1 Tax=Geodia barretti TaxID=519541 RepID=A0AA35RER0_GEOBA|nr:Peroxisomal membrane protein PEX14 [Geodia barretti]
MASSPENSSQEAVESAAEVKEASEHLRENLVDVAVKFLNNPRVIGSPLEQKKVFLQKKGLSDSEIEEAVRLSQLSPPTHHHTSPLPPSTPSQLSPFTTHTLPPPHHRTWRDYALVVAVVGGISYALYKFFKGYAIPWLSWRLEQSERAEETSEAVRQLQTNLDTTVSGIRETTASIRDILTEQREEMQAIAAKVTALQVSVPGSGLAVNEIRDEVASLKGLLLNRHQFPTPTTSHPARGIPAWQRSTQQQQQDQQQDIVGDTKTESKVLVNSGVKIRRGLETSIQLQRQLQYLLYWS